MGTKRADDTGNAAVEKYFRDRGYRGASYVVRDANAEHRPSVWSVKKSATKAADKRGKSQP